MTREKTEKTYENESVDAIVRLLGAIVDEERAVAGNTKSIFWLIVLGYIVAFIVAVVSLLVLL